MKNKFISAQEAAALIKDGDFVMVGGFLGHGTPDSIINAIADSDVKDLTVAVNDTGFPAADPENGVKGEKHGFRGVSELVARHKVKTLYVSHIGTNPETGRQMSEGTLDVRLTPQGTLAERIRAGGFGLGGVLTPTGVGTDVAEGKQVLNLNGKDYLLEMPIHGDVAIIKAWKGDEYGNIKFRLTANATNYYMAFAADTVICEVEELVEVGSMEPDEIDVPAPVIDHIYVRKGEKKPFCPMWQRAKAKAEAKAKEGGK